MTNEEKLKNLNKICIQQAYEESKQLDEEVTKEMNEKVQEQLQQEKLAYQKKMHKAFQELEQEYNRKIWELQKQKKIQLNQKKQELSKKLIKQTTELFLAFVDTPEYKEFLSKSVKKAIEKLGRNYSIYVYLTPKDIQRYGEELKQQYTISKILEMGEDKIGGCICSSNYVVVDNTIQQNILQQADLEKS